MTAFDLPYSRLSIPSQLPADFVFLPAKEKPKRLLILLHGYQLSGRFMLRWLGPELKKSSLLKHTSVLSPCGPYPVPKKMARSFRMGYSWYFYDPYRDLYFIGPELPVQFLCDLIHKLKLNTLPKTIVGYSQGGYLAPFLINRLKKLDHIIGVGCRFLEQEISLRPKIRIDAIHGKKDSVIPWKESHRSFMAVQSKMKKIAGRESGTWSLMPNAGHDPHPSFAKEILTLLLKNEPSHS